MWGKVFLSKETTRWRGLGVQPSTFRSEVQRANHYTTAPPQFEIRGAIKYFAVSRCRAAGHLSLKNIKCLAIRNFQRISTERLTQTFWKYLIVV